MSVCKEPVTEFHKFCPFCGNENIEITTKSLFYELLGEHGSATISIECPVCNLDMYECSYSGNDYNLKREILLRKWNLGIPRRNENNGD